MEAVWWIIFVILITIAIFLVIVGLWILNIDSIDDIWGWIAIIGGFLLGIIVFFVFMYLIFRQRRKEREEEELERKKTYDTNS